MEIKRLLSISLLLIFLLSVCVASAGTGEKNVKVISKDGEDITNGNKKDGDSKGSSDVTKEEEDTATESDITGVEAVSDAVTTGGINIGYRIGDEFLEGGFKIASVGVEERQVTGKKTMTYSLYSKELNPFAEPGVRKSVLITYLFHIAVAISMIFLGVVRYVFQTVYPKKTTAIMAGFSGEYTQFDVACFLILCLLVILMPIFDFLGISYCVLNRNAIAYFMETKTLDIVGANTDSLPTYILVNAAWYLNNVEKIMGEYAVLMMCRLIVVKTWIQAVIVLIGSLTKAAMLQAFVTVGFILVLLMDILTLFFVSAGIEDSISKDNWWYAFAGMFTATAFDALILLGLLVIPVLLIYSRIRSGRFGGRA